ncbi:MAG: VWA domain-containing protein [Myxococcota bacterium]
MADDQKPILEGLQDLSPLLRWRLVLGEAGDACTGGGALQGDAAAADAALSWLYDRDEAGGDQRDIAERGAGSGPSSMTVPDWISEVHRLFPKETIERLEQDAVDRFQIHDVVTNPEVLKRIEPNQTLLKAVLKTKHLMNPEVLSLARDLVRKVVQKLMEELAEQVKQNFSGAVNRQRRTLFKYSRNLDAKRTIVANLGNYDRERKRLYVDKVFFFQRARKHNTKWQIILLVDQSGSMLDSAIHAAVTAACLYGIPSVKTHLVLFDTNVVDLSEDIVDPVEALMKVQLGGGTDIAKAVGYAQQLVEVPSRTILAIVSDFYEGGSQATLLRRVKGLADEGAHVLGLAALDSEANPNFDRELGEKLVACGAHVGAMTPGELAAFVAEKVRR